MTLYLVTGGAGFIGSNLVDALLTAGQRVRVFDNFTTGRAENLAAARQRAGKELEVIRGDVRDSDAVHRASDAVDYVLHMAAIVSVEQSMADPVGTHAVNTTGTLHVLQAARVAGVRHVVLASSCAIYGDNEDLPLGESAPPRPLSPYAASKLAAELYCRAFFHAYGLSTVCLRYFNVYGPRQNPAGDYAAVIPKFVARMAAGRQPTIFGDGRQTRDFVYVGDVVQANLLACQRDRFRGQALNVASGRRTSLLDLVDVLNGLLGTDLAPEFGPPRAGEVRHSAGDAGRLAAALGFRPETGLEAGLRQMIDRSKLSS